jgi:hypothetical protein
MTNTENKSIFFHVGMGKTASTYLQHKVFPYFQDIEFIHHMPRFKKAAEIIQTSKKKTILISREFDQQMEEKVSWFATYHPETSAIIVFRKHDSWIASQYRRFVKNGHAISFQQFFDLQNDKGLFKQIDLNYMHKINLLEKYFTLKPLVLFYDDMQKDPITFIDYLAKNMGVNYDKEKISLSKMHSSYNEKQLKAIMQVAKHIDIEKRSLKNKILYFIRRISINAIRYSTLFIAKYLPDKWFNVTPLISADDLNAVNEYYLNDWKAVKEYAKENNPKI